MEDGDEFIDPLGDTVAMDSPMRETQLGKLDIETVVLDSPYYIGKVRDQMADDVIEDSIEDIVLDSDEEGNEVLSMTSGHMRGKLGKVCAHSLPLQTSGRRIHADELCKLGQPQPAFHHAGAFYREHLHVSPDSGISRVNEKMSPEMNINYVHKDHHRWQCSEKVKRRSLFGDVLNEQNPCPTNFEVMEKARDVPFASSNHEFPNIAYADSEETGEVSEVNALSFVDQFVSVNNLTLSEKVETRRAEGSKSPPTSRAKGIRTLAGRAYSAAKARKPGIFDWSEEQTTESNFAKELEEHTDMGSVGQHLEKDETGTNMPEIFDIGFGTQIAVEAMEALMYADPPNSNANEVPENDISNSPETGVQRKMKSKVWSHGDIAGSDSEITHKPPENKEASNQLHGSRSCSSGKQYGSERKSISLSPLENKITGPGSTSVNPFREHPVNMKKNMNGRNSRVFSQQKEDKIPQRHYPKEDSESVRCKNHGEDPKISSRATKTLKYSSSMNSLERPKDPVSSFKRKRSCKVEFIAPETKRKENIKVQGHKKLGVSGKCSKLGSGGSAEVTILKRNRHNNVAHLNGTTSVLELDLWKYPKRKRTHRDWKRLSNEDGNPSAWFPVKGAVNKIHYPTQNRKTTKWMDGLVAFSQLENQSFTEKRHSVSLSKHKREKSSPGSGNCESAITRVQMALTELDKGKSSRKSCRINRENSISAVAGYSENIKLDAVMDDNEAPKTSKSAGHCQTNLSKSSLNKELTRLGYYKSLPDFLPREARRQSRANARVLFSQHLESNIINQQKNIIARLGFSLASCCSDATHFIADRFLRTRNMLEAIASGKPVVTPSWLESCGQANYHVDEKNYILRDAKKEKEIGFSMPVSLAGAKRHPLLKDRRVLITTNIKPGRELIQSLVKAVQGEAIQKIERAAQEDEIISNDVLILSSEEDHAACVPFLEKGTAVYDSELLLNGIVIQKLEYERHQLFSNYQGSKIGRKKT